MPNARGAPSGSTVPSFMGAATSPTPVGGPGGPSAGRAGAPLVVDVERDGEQQDESLDDRLDRLVDALQLHAVAQDRDEQTTDHGATDGADTTGDGGATDEGRRDGVELEVLPGGRLGDRKSTRLNSSHANISYAVFCLKTNKPVLASY